MASTGGPGDEGERLAGGDEGRHIESRREWKDRAARSTSVPAGAEPVLSALAALTDREFSITERFTDKTRQTFVLAIGFFTIVQTVAFNSFQANEIQHTERSWLFALAIASIAFLFVTAIAVVQSERLISVAELDVDRLMAQLELAYQGDGATAAGYLAQDYAAVVNSQRKSNESRRKRYRQTVIAASISILITTAELVSALAFRI